MFYYQQSTTCPEWNRRVNHQLFFRTTNNEQRTTLISHQPLALSEIEGSTINYSSELLTTNNEQLSIIFHQQICCFFNQ